MSNCKYCGTACPERGEYDRFFDCGLYTERKPTNADRIRSMSDEEMARFLDEISGFQADYLKYKGKAIDAVHLIDWLRQPAEE